MVGSTIAVHSCSLNGAWASQRPCGDAEHEDQVQDDRHVDHRGQDHRDAAADDTRELQGSEDERARRQASTRAGGAK